MKDESECTDLGSRAALVKMPSPAERHRNSFIRKSPELKLFPQTPVEIKAATGQLKKVAFALCLHGQAP